MPDAPRKRSGFFDDDPAGASGGRRHADALTTCPACGHQVARDAPACPNCGKPIAGAGSRAAIVTILVILVLLIFGVGMIVIR